MVVLLYICVIINNPSSCVLIHAVIGRHHNIQFSNISDVHGFVSLAV